MGRQDEVAYYDTLIDYASPNDETNSDTGSTNHGFEDEIIEVNYEGDIPVLTELYRWGLGVIEWKVQGQEGYADSRNRTTMYSIFAGGFHVSPDINANLANQFMSRFFPHLTRGPGGYYQDIPEPRNRPVIDLVGGRLGRWIFRVLGDQQVHDQDQALQLLGRGFGIGSTVHPLLADAFIQAVFQGSVVIDWVIDEDEE
jgi:hypothetical protein